MSHLWTRTIFELGLYSSQASINDSTVFEFYSRQSKNIIHFFTGFWASTLTNPIWFIKTRLQLDRASKEKTLGIRKCVMKVYKENVSFNVSTYIF